ncbi:MAG TPA: phospholipid carrier-dependent glycosyltransferase [Persephonella sp.]|nr:phospholipid carrier-dependent glycosyltransferase [Hydrogenothermaceae bacterium]HIQ24733.1 phospholipid carrier-dependent glycosyltransferase [Persephonella sp.]
MKKIFTIAILLAIIKIIYILFGHIDLSPEEAQYWVWSKFLDVYYYSKPPMIAYFNYISTSIFGDTELGVRINAVLIASFLFIFMYFFTKKIFKDEKIAVFSAFSLIPLVSYNLMSILFLTDTVLMLFYVISLYFFYKVLFLNEKKHLILWGIFSGLALLSKQVFIIIYPVFLLLIYLYKKDLLKNTVFYFSFGISILIGLIPLIIWNINNEFATLKHLFYLSGGNNYFDIKKSLKHLGDYVLSQIAINSIFLFPFFVFAIVKGFKDIKDKNIAFLLSFPAFVFLFFILISLKHRVYENWPAFAYFTLYILVAFYVYKYRKFKQYVILSFISIVSIVFLFYTPLLDKVGLGKFLPPEKDPTKKLVGWKGLAKKVEEIRKNYPDAFLFSDDYFISSELIFYLKSHPFVYCINTGRRKNQFDYWENINSEKNFGKTGIYITGVNIQKFVRDGFSKVVLKAEYNVEYRGKNIKHFNIYVLSNFSGIKEVKTNRY